MDLLDIMPLQVNQTLRRRPSFPPSDSFSLIQFADTMEKARKLGTFKNFVAGRCNEATVVTAFEKHSAVLRYLGAIDPTGEKIQNSDKINATKHCNCTIAYVEHILAKYTWAKEAQKRIEKLKEERKPLPKTLNEALNASSRALLMQKLDRSGTTTSLTAGMGATGVNTSMTLRPVSFLGAPPAAAPMLRPTVPGLGSIPGASLPVTTTQPIEVTTTQPIETAPPSECLLLKNMFDPAVETDLDFDLDIRDDVQEECSKFGQLSGLHDLQHYKL